MTAALLALMLAGCASLDSGHPDTPPAAAMEALSEPPAPAPNIAAPDADTVPSTAAEAETEKETTDTPADAVKAPAPGSQATESSPVPARDDVLDRTVAYDPWERWNRRVHALNNGLDRRVFRPVALGYVKVVPAPVRDSIANFFRNLGGPVNVLNAALQGKPSQAGASLVRFLVNSTFGIGGFIDVATRWRIPDRSEDFGQTLAKWGWKKSRYVELPLFGPRTVRDIVGLAGDAQLNPLPNARDAAGQTALQAIQVINVRTQLLSTDALREDAQDDYTLFRDAWWQRRYYQIWQEDVEATNPDLPDYLRTEAEGETPPTPSKGD